MSHMRVAKGVVGSLLLLLLTGIQSVHAQQARLGLLASQERVEVDSQMIIVVDVSHVQHLHAYSVDVSYDPGIVRYHSLQRLPFFAGETFFASLVDSASGKIVLNEAVLGAASRSGEGGLALLRFVGIRPGLASFRITASALRDSVNTPLPVSNGRADVTVRKPEERQFE